MKCEYCSSEPIRACLRCGCLFCKSHGEVREKSRRSGQPVFNSQCTQCVELSRSQFASIGIVFMVIGVILSLVGTGIAAAGVIPVGLIFISQGAFFVILGLVFRLKMGNRDSRP